jgi:Holliday junction resolvase RusA-like endonuclease
MGSIIGTPGGGSTPPYQPPNQPPYQPPPNQPPYQPVYQQPYQPPYQPPPAPANGGLKVPILMGAVIALLGASIYLFYQVSQLRSDLHQEVAEMRDGIMDEIAKAKETSSVSLQTSKKSVENLQKELADARRQASQLAGDAKVEATKHADELASKLERVQEQQAAKVTAVAADVSQVRDQATAVQSKVGEVTTQVGTLQNDQASTKSELEKTIADLKRTSGDLGVQSGLIATNGKELSALKALGERTYVEFKLAKDKKPEKVGDVQIRLTAADPKKNKYTLTLIADDKTVEKKDRSVNEPVQFYLSRATQPYELVVNEIRKDMIVGYVSAPKVQQARSKQ